MRFSFTRLTNSVPTLFLGLGLATAVATMGATLGGCGDDDDAATGKTGGKSGASGSASGTSGAAGDAGSAGVNGTGGAGGTAGSAVTPDFPTGTGQAAEPEAAYPAGPYGVGIGSIIQNYDFIGYPGKRDVDANLNIDPVMLQLADWYNPHANDPSYQPASAAEDDRLFPPGSPYGEGKAKPKAFVFDISARWCHPCQDESKTEIPKLRKKYGACGGDFFVVIADGAVPGNAPALKDIKSWVTLYKTEFPVALDPTEHTQALFQEPAFPTNVMIDATTMKIVKKLAGVPDDSYYTKLETLIGYEAANKDADGNCVP